MSDRPEHMGLPVAGYRPQSDVAVELVNVNKVFEERLLRRLDDLSKNHSVDPCWIALARTYLEQGFMALNRSIFQPCRVKLPEDAEC